MSPPKYVAKVRSFRKINFKMLKQMNEETKIPTTELTGLIREIAEIKQLVKTLVSSPNQQDEILRGRQIWKYIGWSESYASKSSTKAMLVINGISILRREGKSYMAYRSDIDRYLQRNPKIK